jgi:predicted lipid-binding transport protein (Tim44 family)
MKHERLRTASGETLLGALTGGLAAGFAALILITGSDRMPHTPWIIPLFGLGGFVIGRTIGWAATRGSSRVAAAFYSPVATGTYTHTHSNIDALEARGDYRGAINAWEAVAVQQPESPWPLIRAGELYIRQLKDPHMALERFRHARDLESIAPELHRYASQRIIDLYLGPLNDERRGMAELRRLMESHPGTREADGAAEAIATIRAKRAPDQV